jgi:hypothetical protein
MTVRSLAGGIPLHPKALLYCPQSLQPQVRLSQQLQPCSAAEMAFVLGAHTRTAGRTIDSTVDAAHGS